jgi:hypothetical protein
MDLLEKENTIDFVVNWGKVGMDTGGSKQWKQE